MARIEGVVLPGSKRVEYGLTYLFGIGLTRSREILTRLGINFDKRVNKLSDQDIAAIQREIGDRFAIEGELRKKIHLDIKRLQEIGSYRGDRHKKGLPVRGQRTSTNARTRKGPKRAGMAVALKRKATKK